LYTLVPGSPMQIPNGLYNNTVGKDGIAIAASLGLKTYFAAKNWE